MNTKSIVRNAFGFVNFASMIELYTRLLPGRKHRTFFIFEGVSYSYGEVYERSRRYADFFLSERRRAIESGALGERDRFALGIYMENTPEYLFASFGAGLSNSILFAINTGFRGETLSRVMEQARITHLIVNGDSLKEAESALPTVERIQHHNVLVVGEDGDVEGRGFRALEKEVAQPQTRAARTERPRIDNTSPVLVIYTSGTTGTPKGVPCTHVKLWGAGMVVQGHLRLTPEDRGYICMPLFHSNAWYVGILSLLIAGGSFVLRRKFSASAFEPDMLEHGVTFLNYVGQPLHYIVAALEKKYGSGEAVGQALARHPRNRFRIAYGNGATAIDRKKLIRYLGMEHVYEIYGSTEAVITTVNLPGDPIESVGKVPAAVRIFDEQGRQCAPGEVDERGRLRNYDQAVGEIVKKVGSSNLRFDGYYGNPDATEKKFRNGYYHSGDLGHIRLVNGKRYLYFNGRTDDWIRKDGENFSAENVQHYAQAIPGVDLAIAYGTPSEVSDEKVMVAVQLHPGGRFDPKEVFEWYEKQQRQGGMDPKWMPDYIRIVETFPVSNTQKIMVRPYKKENFNIERHPGMRIFFRSRGDDRYRELTEERFREIRRAFAANGREALLVQS